MAAFYGFQLLSIVLLRVLPHTNLFIVSRHLTRHYICPSHCGIGQKLRLFHTRLSIRGLSQYCNHAASIYGSLLASAKRHQLIVNKVFRSLGSQPVGEETYVTPGPVIPACLTVTIVG